MFGLFLSLIAGFGAVTPDTLPFDRVQAIANETYAEMRIHEKDIHPTIEISYRPEPTPLGVIPGSAGTCRLIINTNKQAWAEWNRFLNEENQSNWYFIIKASIAHELGHCMPEHRHGWQNVQLSDESLRGLSHGNDSQTNTETRILKQELFADTVAVLFAKEMLAPEARDAAISAMMTARVNYGKNDPSHNTARELSAVIESDGHRLDHESYGQAAARLLANINVR